MSDPYESARISPEDDIYESAKINKISPVENVLQRAAQVARSQMGPSLQAVGGGMDTAAFGIPGLITDKYAPEGLKEYIKPQGMGEAIGRGVGNVGGFMLGGPEKLAAKGVERLLPKGANLLARSARGLGKGVAAMGSLEAPQVLSGSESPSTGALKTGGGALLQGGIEGFGPPIAKGVVASSKAIGKGITKAPKYLKDVFSSPSTIKNLETEVSNHQDFIKNSLVSLREEAKNLVMSGKAKISDVASQNSSIYRNILDSIDKDLTSSGNPITKEEFYKQVVEPSLRESNSIGLPGGAAKSRILSMAEELSPKTSLGESGTDMLGLKIPVQSSKPENLSLNDIKNLKNSIYEAMNQASQSGTQQHLAKDVSADIFQNHYQNFIKNRVSDFYKLQSEYGPQIEAQRFGFNKFEPSESSVNKGINVLTRSAKAKAGLREPNIDEEAMLSQLEKGTERFKGTGSLRGKTEDIASGISKSKEGIKALEPRLDYARQLRTVRDDIIKWGITAMLGGTSYAVARGVGGALAHSTDSVY